MKKFLLLFLLFTSLSNAQNVTITTEDTSEVNLANTLLNDGCVEINQVSVSSLQSVAYFSNNDGNFPIGEGIIIRTGDATLSSGAYSDNNLSSQVNNLSDEFLESLNQTSGQSALLTDTAFLEFEFTPLSSDFNFNFLFASNEYGQWQCLSSDVFAFLLTNLDTGETQNLAVIPGTDTPVSVKNIKDSQYNSSCPSDFPEYFLKYNVNQPQSSRVNMRGYTQVMNASAEITPGTPYKIRLVIADSNDANFDSAIFLEAGSFNAAVDLGEDQNMCNGDSTILSTGLDAEDYTHQWFLDDVLLTGENQNELVANQLGAYKVEVTRDGTNCLITDTVQINGLSTTAPENITTCNTGETTYTFDLTEVNEQTIGLQSPYQVHYFSSLDDANNSQPIADNQLENYTSTGDETIYIQFYNTENNFYCGNPESFQLLVNDGFEVNQPDPIDVCTVEDSDTSIDLTQLDDVILDDANGFNITYHLTQDDALNKENGISASSNFMVPEGQATQVVWIRVEDDSSADCFNVISATFNLNNPPQVSELEDEVVCEEFILPSIAHGQYFTEANGGGSLMLPGDAITETGDYYIFNGPDENGCTNQSSFRITIVKEYAPELEHCDYFKVPFPPAGGFYTAPGGPDGSGEEIFPESYLYQSQTIYYYAEVDDVFCTEKALDITVFPLPPVDEPEDVITCGSYTLPALTNGNYFTQSGGNGTALEAGFEITNTSTINVYNNDGTCDNNHEFTVYITPEFEDMTVCGGYELPSVEVGGFYAQSGGQGEPFEENEYIETSQTVFYFAETTTQPNCTQNNSFYIEVIPLPPVDTHPDMAFCEEETYILPAVTNGQYFTESGRNGQELSAGYEVTSTQTIYINNLENGCQNETFFEIEIRDYPEVENFTDVYSCDPYELPNLEHGTYYTETLAQGIQLSGGDIIDETQTIYIFNEYDDLQGCYSEDSFTVHIEGVQFPDFPDVYACETYELPPLEEGGYYTEPGGNGLNLPEGYLLNSTKQIFVYAIQGDRFVCESEKSFMVNISKPSLDHYQNVESCGSYTLPTTDSEIYDLTYSWSADGEDIIQPNEYEITQNGTHQVYVRASLKDDPTCFTQRYFTVTIYPNPELYIEGDTLCLDPVSGEVDSPAYLISGLDASEFTVNWYFNGNLVHTGSELEAYEAGEYYVETEKVNPEVGADCNYLPTTVKVEEAAKAVIEAKVTEPFKDVANISVEVVNGVGEYMYSLNDGPYQMSNVFENVKSGPHVVKVKGLKGFCGVTTADVEVVKYPRFFTPNQDGANDVWNIFDLQFQKDATVSIYDRFGKLLKVMSPSDKGWNGRFQNKQMPSTDYWFTVDYVYEGQERQFKSHFTLKR